MLFQLYSILYKDQIKEVVKKINTCQDLGKGRMDKKVEHRGFFKENNHCPKFETINFV